MAKTSVSSKSEKSEKSEKVEKKTAPPKDRVSMSEDEVNAAVAGTLKPRDKKGDKNQDALKNKDEKDRPTGRPIGVTTGLPILGAWCYVFQENEKVRTADRKTDKEISEWMKKEFPGRDTPAFDHPAGCRRDYNNGIFTKARKPKTQSNRYDENGVVMEPGTREVSAKKEEKSSKSEKKEKKEKVTA